MIEQEPNPTRWMDYGALVVGAAMALWSRLSRPSKEETKKLVVECLEEIERDRAIDRLIDGQQHSHES